MSPQITAHSRRSGNVFPLCLGSALRLLGILPSPSTFTRKRTTSRSECAFCLSTLCGVRFLVPPMFHSGQGVTNRHGLPLWERPICAPDDSLGALTSTSTLARIFVLAAPISRPVQDGRPAVLRAACVPWLLRHRRSVFCAAMTRYSQNLERHASKILSSYRKVLSVALCWGCPT